VNPEDTLREWIGQSVTVVAAGEPQDKYHNGRLEAVDSVGCVVQMRGGVEHGTRFFPWGSVRELRLRYE
jgi:hypothetical protein